MKIDFSFSPVRGTREWKTIWIVVGALEKAFPPWERLVQLDTCYCPARIPIGLYGFAAVLIWVLSTRLILIPFSSLVRKKTFPTSLFLSFSSWSQRELWVEFDASTVSVLLHSRGCLGVESDYLGFLTTLNSRHHVFCAGIISEVLLAPFCNCSAFQKVMPEF